MGICNSLGLPVQPSTFLDHLQTSAIRAGTYGAASMALLHTKPSEAGFQFVTGTAAGAIGGWGANQLGDLRAGTALDFFEHKLAHGFLGAGMGAILDFDHPLRGMVAGAVGGFVAESTAALTEDLFGHPWAGNAGILSGPLAAFLLDQNVDVASATASNAIVNNFYAVHPSLYAEVDQAQVEQGQATREALEFVVSTEWPFLVGIKEALGRQFGDLFTETNQMLHGSPNLSRLERTGLYYRQALALENMAHTNLLPTTYFGAALEGAALVPMGALRQGAVKLPQIIRQGGRFLRLERPIAQPITRAINANITWGKGIQAQGLPWENYLANRVLAPHTRLPQNFKTFDFFDRVNQVATSAKTLNTQTAAKLADPNKIYYSLKKNIDVAAGFREHILDGVKITAPEIKFRRLEVAIPQGTISQQWEHIKRAIEYGKTRDVIVNITTVK